MKKLVIAAAIAMVAVASQAATFKWSTQTQAYGPAVANLNVPGHYSPGTATTDRMKSEASNQSIVWTYAMVLSDGTSSENLNGTITTYSSNKIAQNIDSTLFTIPTGSDETTYSWNIVITGTYTVGTDTYTITSDAIVGSKTYTASSNADISTAAPSGWTVTGGAPVPEPTSGLLMLLGVAGLALRRRRA